MNSNDNTKEVNTMTYNFRIDFVDGTFKTVSIDGAASIEVAKQRASLIWVRGVENVSLIGMIDQQPQVFLAF